jgi:RecG-like helicase
MRILLVAVMCILPTLSSAHSMSPGFETEYAVSNTLYKTYTIENKYKFPATYKVEVFNKDMTPATHWKAKVDTFKMNPNSKKEIKLKFKSNETRKLIVCSTLTNIGYDNAEASIISRVCSRLIIVGATRL